ncbi:MAG: hypothetical protein HQK69_08745 [Desulfamplus sp.]|nr:hypothetical protein [Desulfamplus sp.]
MKVSDRLTEIAETVMNKVIEISWNHTVQKYGVPSGLNLSKFSDSNSVKESDCLSDNDKFDYLSNDINKNIKSNYYLAPKIGFHPSESPLSTTYSASTCSKFFSPGFAAIAYGKLGGIELGYKSDLDMVFIHSSYDGYTEGGPRSIENIRFYTFLGQRIISSLTLNTQAGKLYEADMRLRPNGQSGMIVSHIDAFHDYIKNEAWTWEHQAIIRARPIGGDPALQERFNAIRESILCIERSPELLKKEVGEMRERMRKEHLKSSKDNNNMGIDSSKSDTELFDLKQGRGGIIDIEFLVQYLVLQYASEHRSLTKWTDNVRLLETLANEKILKPQESEELKKGYLKLRQMVHHLNLQEREKKIPIKEFKDEANSIIEIFENFLKKP